MWGAVEAVDQGCVQGEVGEEELSPYTLYVDLPAGAYKLSVVVAAGLVAVQDLRRGTFP